MGRTEDGHPFCDRCYTGTTEAQRKANPSKPNFYRCGNCPETHRPLMCVRCVAVHYRQVHPVLWMTLVVPELKKTREEQNETAENVY